MSEPFRTIVADPPWPFGDKLPGPKRGAVKHYKGMNLDDIKDYLAPDSMNPLTITLLDMLAPDCRLFLWRVSALQIEALITTVAWGFVPKSEVVWVKTLKSKRWLASEGDLGPVPVVNMGMGRQVRLGHECCIIATRGKPVVLAKDVRSVLFAPLGKHSEKPEAFYKLVETLSPGPYLELFARRERPGWTCFGDELNGKD